MIARLLFWWSDRTVRERRLILLLGVIAVPMLLWFALIKPFGLMLDHQRLRRDEAERSLNDVRAMAAELSDVGSRSTRILAGPIAQAIRADAEAAGFTVSRVEPDGTDGAILVMDAVRAQPFFTWAATAEQRHGLIVARLTARPNSDATLAVSITLHRRKP